MRISYTLECQSCGIEFPAGRADARFCGSRCTKRATRALSKPKDNRKDLIAKALRASWNVLLGEVKGGRVGLLAPRSIVLEELNGYFKRRGPFTDAELVGVLKAEGWKDYASRSAEPAT